MKNGIKTLAMWLIIAVIFLVVLSSIVENSDAKLKYSELIANINSGKVEAIQIESDGKTATVALKDDKIKKETDNHELEVLSTKLKKLFDKLHKQRQESLDKNGEMGTYNIIWKVLRRSGHLDKIWEIINTVYNRVNSIK